MIVQDLPSPLLERGEVAIPSLDVEWVEVGCVSCVLKGEVVRVPGRVVVDGVAVPVSCVREWLARVVDVRV